ncbi:uncharacterized protein LOC117167256 [Belonocnema kinseyi]|uniref:uncharacterized protein LOC117167256 n=1 Tax=Belonocnema kinseyi TaxID=2817044 RepID=UPI00143E07C3|nr:uncharacterized protein LOC117167256 [Belonocnema kinseyi]
MTTFVNSLIKKLEQENAMTSPQIQDEFELQLNINKKSYKLARTTKPGAIHPLPLQVHVHFCERFEPPGAVDRLPPRLYFVEISNEMGQRYVTGVEIEYKLHPFLAPRADHPNIYERVKIRVDGNTANVTVPILRNDPLNNRFNKLIGGSEYMLADISG